MQPSLGRYPLGTRQRGVAAPANFQTAEEVGLGARHAIERRRPKSDLAEDFRIGMETQRRAAPVLHRSAVRQRRERYSPAVALGPQPPVAGNLDLELVGER